MIQSFHPSQELNFQNMRVHLVEEVGGSPESGFVFETFAGSARLSPYRNTYRY